jgi:hypothetical protein
VDPNRFCKKLKNAARRRLPATLGLEIEIPIKT